MWPSCTRRTAWRRIGVLRLEDVALGPGPDRLDHEVPVVVGGEHDHPGLGDLLAEPAGRLDAVHLRHADVQDDEVGLGLPGQIHHLGARRRFAQDLDPFGGLDVPAQSLADERVVVAQQHPDRHMASRLG
jgi:hypothetical protein